MSKIKSAVIGVGYLGRYHAEKYAALDTAELIGVCDANPERAKEIGESLNVTPYTDYHDLLDKVDAVSIAAPTPLHFEIASVFLSAGKHVLLEKPIATTVKEADELIALAKSNNALLQIGHLERFNNAYNAIHNKLNNPRFVDSVRLAPFKLRGTDVNVVLDLMIHDIDIIQALIGRSIKKISANGASVLSDLIDIANARIEFDNGCVANVTASRISLKQERRLRIFQHDCYMSLDLDHKTLYTHAKGDGEMFPGIPKIVSGDEQFEQGDALADQIASFIHCIQHNDTPRVTGEDGKSALATAIEITRIMRQSNLEHEGHELGAHHANKEG